MAVSGRAIAGLAGRRGRFLHLPDGPEQARCLSTSDRAALQNALHDEAGGHHAIGLMQTLRSGPVLFFSALYLLIQMGVYGLIFFLPSHIAGLLGRAMGWQVGLLSVVPWAAALVATLVLPAWAYRTGHRAIAALACAAGGASVWQGRCGRIPQARAKFFARNSKAIYKWTARSG